MPFWRTIAMPGVTGRGTLEVAVPAHWLDCPVIADDDFAHWMARDWRDPDVTLWLRLELHDLEEDDAGPVGSSGPRLLDWLRGRCGEDAGRRVVTASRRPDGAVLRTVADFTAADGRPFLHHRWHLAELQAGLLCEATAMLTVPGDRERQAQLDALVDRFAAELPRMRPGLGSPAAPAADEDSHSDDPYRAWQTITCYGCIRLRVPAVWRCGYDPEVGMWCGYRRGDGREENSGVMWLTYDVYDAYYDDTAPDRLAFEGAVFEIPVPDDAQDLRYDGAPDDRVLRYRQLGTVGDEALVLTSWLRVIVRGWRIMKLHLFLVHPAPRAESPAIARFVEQMDRELRAAAITIPDH